MISYKNRRALSMRTNVVVGLVLALAAGSIASSAVFAARKAPLCFGKKATIVGTNRDPIRSVKLVGTARSDVIVGLGGSDRIEGRGGDDLICAGGGEDYVLAGDGDDKLRGGARMDTLIGGKGRDHMWGGGNTDSLRGGSGDDRLFGGSGHEDSLIGGAGNDLLDGGRGYDLAEFWDSPGGIEADLTTGTATGYGDDELISIEGLIGSNGDDALTGDDLSNNLQGGDGNDVIRALGSSADGGMDILRSAGGENILDGGDGPDIASYNLNPWGVTADLAAGTTTTPGFGSDTLIGIENLTGSKNDDTLIGDDGDNVIIGNGGDDTMDGRGGTDEVSFIESREPVNADLSMGSADSGEWGSDTFVNFENLSGSVWRDVLTGDDGPNFIWGGDRADSIFGLGGDDVLIGARGTDEANGGADSDACDAETEVDCELDPPDLSNAASHELFVSSTEGNSSACMVGRIAFVRDFPRRARSDIYSINPNGTGITKLTATGDAWSPAWSPDGTRIAYDDWSDGDGEIYVMGADGSNVVQLTDNMIADATPAWSPDGEWIAFARSDDDLPDSDIFDIYKMRADGSEITPLTESEAQEWTPTWSPDSSRIAFFSDDKIVVMNADGTEPSQLQMAHLANSPDWASGERIFYAGDHETGLSEIHMINADGTGKKRLTRRAGEDQSPSVSPNGRRITYGRDYDLATMRTDGARVRMIHRGRGDVYAPDWGRTPCN